MQVHFTVKTYFYDIFQFGYLIKAYELYYDFKILYQVMQLEIKQLKLQFFPVMCMQWDA